ncbi:Protein kinase domain [Quillaja saponaria]|uniref:RING-type E3 ubiquitin transferase n=1 Tax=Quillaja saponaria TaxID=32244 RepID=A0AAD7M648_QUISA|nr:Protein kinase domain [Quillaja saponaria]
MAKLQPEKRVAVAIDSNKTSQFAMKWTLDNLIGKTHVLTLVHVKQRATSIATPTGNHVAITDVNEGVARAYKQQLDNQVKELFIPFRVFCQRKNIKCNEFVLEETDVAKALIDYITTHLIEVLVVGAPSRSGLVRRFRTNDIPSTVSKGAPTFCTVYVIAKGKIQSVRSATSSLPAKTTQRNHVQQQPRQSPERMDGQYYMHNQLQRASDRMGYPSRHLQEDMEIKSPFKRGGRSSITKSYELLSETDISFVSSGRPSTERMFPSISDNMEPGTSDRLSSSSEFDRISFGSSYLANRSVDMSSSQYEFSSSSLESGNSSSWSSQNMDDVEAEMRRLRQELKQTIEMYSTACKEALIAKQKAMELHRRKMEEQKKLEEARLAEEAALALAEKEKAKCKAALEAAEASHRIAELEAQKRRNAEMNALIEADQRKRQLDSFTQSDIRYRKYTIEEIEAATEYFSDSRKIGEGGYGPVYRCELDHTPVAVKVLRPDAAQGRSQFQQEVQVLSCIRHPNMVLLLGACPEYGCLVYEYMSNGSLDDRLFRRGNTPVLPWQLRFQIAAEIGTGLLFLHKAKPEPLVHRDLKPGNILLDRNYVSKISDVGLARLVPPSVANSVTQYRMTSAAGTFCYIDPEYQQTGMLGIKSDIYSLGIMLLQLITARPPMGLTHHVERAIERGTFQEMLDPAVPDWPVEEAIKFAKLALQCAELRRNDRPDLGKVLLPELNRLRTFAKENLPSIMLGGESTGVSPRSGHNSTIQDVSSGPQLPSSGYESSKSRSSTGSSVGGL